MQKTDFPFEVLIHDDASTDGTEEIIREYEKKYPDIIKPIYEIENQWCNGRKGSATFNFPRAKGKYIAICEGDDYWTDPYKLQKQVDFLMNNKSFVLVHTNYNHYHTETELIIKQANDNHNIYYNKYNKMYYSATSLFLDILYGKYFIKTCTSMFATKKLKQVFENDTEFLRRNFLMSDTFIFCELSQLGLFHYMPEVTAVANKLRVSAKNNPDPFKRILFSKSLSELALYLLYKHSFMNEYNMSIKRHIDFILENALRYNQKNWIDDIISKYKNIIKFKHKVIIFIARNNTCRKLAVVFIDIFINLPQKIFRRAKRTLYSGFK